MCIPSTTRWTSLSSLLFILIFIKSHIMFLHIQFVLHILLFYCFTVLHFLYSIAHFTSYFFFYLYIYIYIYSCVVLLLYNLMLILFIFYSLHCPLSGPDLTYISLLIIPCIIYHVTNKETLVPCAPMSIVCPLPSCYLIIVSVAPAVSPSLPSFVSLYSSPCVCSPVLIRCLSCV